jgi:hypothetical protein
MMTAAEYREARDWLDQECRRRIREAMDFAVTEDDRREALRVIDAEHGAAIDRLHERT